MSNIRSLIYWALDYYKGGIVKKHLFDITKKLRNPLVEEEKQGVLNKLLRHAQMTVDYYKDSSAYLKDFPVLNKEIIRSNFNRLISNDFMREELKKVVTSGSTGLPFQVLHDLNKTKRNTADTMFFANMANFKIGGALVYLKIWNEINAKSFLRKKMENIIPVNVVNLSDKEIEKYIKELNASRQKVSFLGYASALENIAKFVITQKVRVNFKTRSVITMSEALSSKGRKAISKAFNCQSVFSRYSNVENGIIAQQFSMDSDEFLINEASYIVEILDDDGSAVPEGQVGRIIITDLFNYGMPLIRYDTGDIGVVGKSEILGNERTVFKRIEGRKMDALYNTKGELLSSFIVTNGMWKYAELLQYQFIQKSANKYLFKLNIPTEFERENELLEDFRQILGEDAKLEIEYVNEIPLLSSGKRKKVVNEMNS